MIQLVGCWLVSISTTYQVNLYEYYVTVTILTVTLTLEKTTPADTYKEEDWDQAFLMMVSPTRQNFLLMLPSTK